MPDFFVGWVRGIEPMISGTTIRRFNLLSYTHRITVFIRRGKKVYAVFRKQTGVNTLCGSARGAELRRKSAKCNVLRLRICKANSQYWHAMKDSNLRPTA